MKKFIVTIEVCHDMGDGKDATCKPSITSTDVDVIKKLEDDPRFLRHILKMVCATTIAGLIMHENKEDNSGVISDIAGVTNSLLGLCGIYKGSETYFERKKSESN